MYLAAPCEDVNGDPIGWWVARRAIFGTLLVRMAHSYLTVPGVYSRPLVSSSTFLICTLVATTVDVERIFSRGHLVLSHI